MHVITNPRYPSDELLLAPFRQMANVLSLSCVISDAMERECTMDPELKPRAAKKKNHRSGVNGSSYPRGYRRLPWRF